MAYRKKDDVIGTLVITLIALSADLVNLDKEGIATLMKSIKTGNLSAATLARACGDTRQMAKAAQTFFEKEAAEQIVDMSVSQARYLLKTGEQAYKAAGGTIRLGKTEILKLLDNCVIVHFLIKHVQNASICQKTKLPY